MNTTEFSPSKKTDLSQSEMGFSEMVFKIKILKKIIIFLMILIIILSFFWGVLWQKVKTYDHEYAPETATTVTYTDNINNGPSIDSLKTVNTDNWKRSSDTFVKTWKFEYTYSYPQNLYAVPSPRGYKNTIYFFENETSYYKYLECINDKTVDEYGVGRDWEGGCDMEKNLLFQIGVAVDSLDSYDPSDLVRYSDWLLPLRDRMKGGPAGRLDIEAGSGGIYVYMSVPGAISDEKISGLTTLDPYDLFIHILSSFEIKNNRE